MKSCQLGVLRHKSLDGLVNLVSGLLNHEVDVHVSLDTVGLEKSWILSSENSILALERGRNRLLRKLRVDLLLLLSLSDLILLLLQVDDLDGCHLHLDILSKNLNVLDGLGESVLLISSQSGENALLV